MRRFVRTLVVAASAFGLAGCVGDDDATGSGGSAGTPRGGTSGQAGSSGGSAGHTGGKAGRGGGAAGDKGAAGDTSSEGGTAHSSGGTGDNGNPDGGAGESTGGVLTSNGGSGGSNPDPGEAGDSAGGLAGGGGEAGGGGDPLEPCIKVTPGGDDALGAASGGELAFGSLEGALAFADAHRSVATRVCVAAGASCGANFSYAGPAGADLAMRDGISVYANYESARWTRCADSVTTLSLDEGHVVAFGSDIASTTALDGFTTGAIHANGSVGATLVDVDATTIALTAAPGSVVRGCSFEHLESTGSVERTEISGSTGGDAVVSSCEGELAIVGNAFRIDDFSGSGSAVALSVLGTCHALIDSNVITSFGGDGVNNYALGCGAPCTVSGNTISVTKTGDLSQPPSQPPPNRGDVIALSCTGCVEVSHNAISNSVPVSPLYNRSSGYVVKGARIIDGSNTLVARNTISSGCGDDSMGLIVMNARVENNVVRGGCARQDFPNAPSYKLSAVAVYAAQYTDLHSNLMVSASPEGGVNTALGLFVDSAIPVRNNVIGAQGQAILYAVGATPFLSNVIVPGSGTTTVAALNALPGSSGNIAAECYAVGSTGPYLYAGSPCIDAGTTAGAPADDLDGELRDEHPDIGPDEWSVSNDPCGGGTCSGHGRCSLLAEGPCQCDAGYWPAANDPTACVVDKCKEGCDPLVLCTRDGNEAVCGPCPPGYDGTGETCTDVDECADNHGDCDPLVTCVNTSGSYGCGPCPPGYAGTGETGCVATTTCTSNPCQNGGSCVPDVSTYTCNCLPGLTGAVCNFWFKEITLGPWFLCGVRTDGALRCRNFAGIDMSVPAGTFVDVVTDNQHYCALSTDGSITCGGDGPFGAATPPAGTFKALDTNRFHTCAIRSDDTLTCFGLNVQGSTQPPGGTFKAVAVGGSHTCAIASDDSIQCFGTNTYGETTPPSGTFSALSLGASHGCAIRTDQTIACWGQDNSGDTTPPSGTFKAIDSAGYYSCAIRTDGTLACWGSTPSNGPPSGTFTQLATAWNPGGPTYDACALRNDHVVVCWGAHGWSAPTGGTQ